jgi:hypothetical protein
MDALDLEDPEEDIELTSDNSLDPDVSDIASLFLVSRLSELKPDVIDTFEKYKGLYRLRHDLFHRFVCDERKLSFGEVPVYELFPELEGHKNYQYIKRQSPDIVSRNGQDVLIIEIAVSRSSITYQRKMSKYYILVDALRSMSFNVTIEVIVLPLLMNEEDIRTLSLTYQLSYKGMTNVIDNVRFVESIILTLDAKHPEWFNMMMNRTSADFPVCLSSKEVFDLFDSLDRKPFNSRDDLTNVLSMNECSELSESDEKILDHIATHALSDETLELLRVNDVNIGRFWETHDKMAEFDIKTRSKTHISVYPLPMFRCASYNLARSTLSDEINVKRLKEKLALCNDAYLTVLSEMSIKVPVKEEKYYKSKGLERKESECIGKPKISKELSFEVAIEGPGRKHLIKGPNASKEHLDAQRSKSLYYTGSKLETKTLEEVVNMFSVKPPITSQEIDPENVKGVVWDYLRFTQSVYQELNLNFLRKELRSNHIIKPTIVDGVYIVLHKGSPYLTGAKNTILWFRLIADESLVRKQPGLSSSWCFKRMQPIGQGLFATGWQSTDPHRLSHYIRCYDKVLMAYLSYLQSSFDSRQSPSSSNLVELYNSDKSDALGIIASVFLEDKRCTSKMLQDARYVVMSALSIRRYWNELLDKFSDPIRSPLQLLLLRRIVSFIDQMHNISLSQIYKLSKFGNTDPDLLSNYYKFAGSQISMPRLITKTPGVNSITFQQILSEMYFTMLFNKDQDDPTHSSFQVLEKILKGEDHLEIIKKTGTLHTGLESGDLEDIKKLITQKKDTHVFSRRAIMIASKLQSRHQRNSARGNAAYVRAGSSPLVNKTLDEFATFKSSAVFTNEEFSQSVVGYMQNKRRRCLDGVSDLLKKGLIKSSDVFRETKHEETCFQVFKKNQIGGVREILILDISTRIRINILESYCRVICSLDEREMLTHGDLKNKIFTNIQKELKSNADNTGIVHHNFDKKRWGPSFMPIQFFYMFVPFKEIMGNYYYAFLWLLMKHTNKKCYYPDHLIRAWINHADKEHTRDPLLTEKKKKFLNDKKLSFVNESNMGQGILHYTSSLFHLCVVSMREEVYKRMCVKLNIAPCQIIDLVSSDDSYTAQSFSKDQPMSQHVKLLLKAQSVVERLLNVETSKSKSSISPVVGEFNSLFISNLTTYPTLIKFSLASVDTFGTDSFSQLVKESSNSMRSLVENGGTLELYNVAQKMNKKYAEMIFHTQEGGINDPSILLDLDRADVPFQYGVYPMISPLQQLTIGPECHNLIIYQKLLSAPNSKIESALSSVHSVMSSDNVELIANYNDTSSLVGDINLVTVTRIDKRLKRLRVKSRISKQQINDHFISDPLLIIRKAESLEEVDIKTHMKLYQNSAIDAMKVTAGSLYFGRLGAAFGVKCFSIRGNDNLLSYKEAVLLLSSSGLEMPAELKFFFDKTINFLKAIQMIESAVNNNTMRSNLEVRSYQTLSFSSFVAQLTNPLNRVLSCMWVPDSGVESNNSIMRDWTILQTRVPFLKDTMDETLKVLNDDSKQAISKLMLIMMRLQSYSQSKMKGFIYGSSSSDPMVSADILIKQNKFIGLTSDTILDPSLNELKDDQLMKMFNLFNEFILKVRMKLPTDGLSSEVDMTTIESYTSSKNCPDSHKKRFLMMIMYFNLSFNIKSWTKRTGTILPYWVKPQRKVNNKWIGSFELITYYSDSSARMYKDDTMVLPELMLSPSNDDKVNGVLIMETCKVYLEKEEIDNIEIYNLLGEGTHRIHKGRLINCPSETIGFAIKFGDFTKQHPITHKIQMNEGYSDLLDRNGNKLIRIQNALFQVDRPCFRDGFTDFNVNEISYKHLILNGVLRSSFSTGQLSDKQILDLIGDKKLATNYLSNETIDRYRTANVSEELYNLETNLDDSSGEDSNSFDVAEDEDLDAKEEFMANFDFGSLDFKEEDLQMMRAWSEEEINADDYKLDEIFTTSTNVLDLFSVQKKLLRRNPVLWTRVLWLKPMLISRYWLKTPMVNHYSILKAIQQELNPEVIVSMMLIYQLLKSVNKEAISPRSVYIRADREYYRKIKRCTDKWWSIL